MRSRSYVLLAACLIACDAGRDDKGATLATATSAMAAVNASNAELDRALPRSLRDAVSKVLFDPRGAAAMLARDVLPQLDRHLAVADHAIRAADAYAATGAAIDPKTRESLDTLRTRTASLRRLRRELDEIRADLAAGPLSPEETERITSRLMGAGVELMLSR